MGATTVADSKQTRTEKDSLGTREVPAESYYGIQALRGKENFPISGQGIPPEVVRALGGAGLLGIGLALGLGIALPVATGSGSCCPTGPCRACLSMKACWTGWDRISRPR